MYESPLHNGVDWNKLRRIHFVMYKEQHIAVLIADNPKVLDVAIVDENIHIYGVVVYGKNKK